MSKHKGLTLEEYAAYSPDKKIPAYLEAYRKKNQLEKEEMNILDWGCGRGLDVLWLRDKGYNAYGVDIDSEPISNGIDLFKAKGYEASTLRQSSPEGKTDFPDGFFHVVISNQVFEHVSDIEAVAEETRRVTREGGTGYHIFPSSKRIIEGHLFMPFIHWLPKNKLRKYLIAICVMLNIEPHWPELDDMKLREKTDAYFEYSINHTFYRKPSFLRRKFRKHGFHVSFETINNPRLTNHKLLGPLTKYRLSRSLINFVLLSSFHVELHLEKLNGSSQ
ncbi:MAG: class I SAM-dependent methyltransferase [Bacteroidota bacterium]